MSRRYLDYSEPSCSVCPLHLDELGLSNRRQTFLYQLLVHLVGFRRLAGAMLKTIPRSLVESGGFRKDS